MGGFSLAHNSLAQAMGMMWPDRPKWMGGVLVATTLGAAALDLAVEKYAAKPLPESDLSDRLIKLYEEKAAELSTQHGGNTNSTGVTVNVINQSVASNQPANQQTSRYMMEEGNTDINTDCFSCASAHLAGIKASLERAKGAVLETGECGKDCKEWLSLGVREGTSLLAKDWTDDRVRRLPPGQKAVIERYRQQVRDLTTGMLGGSKQAQALNEGHGLLDESVRFANAGDDINHPEVFDRLKDAEVNLTAAERTDIYHYDTETANELRSVRQAVGSKVDSPDALKQVWQKTRKLTDQVNNKAFDALGQDKINSLADQAADMFTGFKADRLKAGEKAS